jgi:hypothetical protein
LLIFFLTELYIQLNQNGKELDQNNQISSKNVWKLNRFKWENKTIKSVSKNTKEFYNVEKKAHKFLKCYVKQDNNVPKCRSNDKLLDNNNNNF